MTLQKLDYPWYGTTATCATVPIPVSRSVLYTRTFQNFDMSTWTYFIRCVSNQHRYQHIHIQSIYSLIKEIQNFI